MLRYADMVNLRLRQNLDNASSFLQRHGMIAINLVRFSSISSNNDKWNFQIRRLLLCRFLVVFQNVVDRRRLAEQVKVRIWCDD